MSSQGVIFKRCGCQDPRAGVSSAGVVPQLAQGGHGSWYFHVSVTNLMGRRERVRRGGYPTQAAARQARDAALGRSRQDQTSHAWTLARWLRYWLSTRVGIRPTTRLSHTHYIERFLIPHLGNIRLAELTARQLTAFFATVAQQTNRFGQPHTPTTLAHIRTTLRAALNSAIRGTRMSEGIASHTGSRPGSSQVTGRHRPWQPLGNHITTTQNSINGYIRC
jgi:hypothetical protein